MVAPTKSATPSSVSQPIIEEKPPWYCEKPIGRHWCQGRIRRQRDLQRQLLASTDATEKDRIRQQLAQCRTWPWAFPNIEEGDYTWYYTEFPIMYCVNKSTDLEKEFLKLKYDDDMERFIRNNHSYSTVLGRGPPEDPTRE